MGIPSQLKELVSEVPDHAQFIKRHGYLLDLVLHPKIYPLDLGL